MSFATAASGKSVWGFSPQSIPGLALWLDGADTTSITGTSSVTAWRDKSGSGYSVVPNSGTIGSATLNGLNVINFGAGVMRVDNFVWSSSFTQLFVGYVATGDIIIDTLASSTYGDYVYTGNGALMNINTYATNTGVLQVTDSVAGSVIPKNTWFIFSIGYGSTGTAAINYTLNGTVRTTTVYGGSGGSATNPALPLYISGATTSFGTGVQFAELIHFNSVLTTAQRQQVEGYLAAKWGLKANLPATHPYSTGSIIPFNRPFYPTDIPGCSLWFDAADRSSMTFSPGTSNVTQWNDKSGNGYNASNSTYAAPTYSATGFNTKYPGLLFNGYSTMLVTPSILPTPVLSANGTDTTIFVVFNYTGRPVSGGFVLYGLGSQANIYVVRTPWNTGGDAGGAIIDIGGDARIIAQFGSANPAQLYSIFRSGASHYFYQFGSLTASNLSSTGTVGTTSQPLNIGGGLADSQWFNSYISEFIIFNTALTTSQRQQVEQYLTWKWGLPIANLPTGHPGKLLPAFGTPFTPKSVAGLQLWLDAADSSTITGTSTVTAWRDKSGNGGATTGYVGTPTMSTINNVPAVSLNGSSYLYGPTTNTTTTVTCYVVATMASGTPNNAGLFTVGRVGYEDYRDYASFALFTRYPDINSIYSTHAGSPGGTYYNSTVVNTGLNVPFLIGEMADGTNVIMYLNGNTMGSVNNPQTSAFAYTTYAIGSRNTASASYSWNGLIGEIILFNSALTTPQRQQVEGYLAWKWGLQSSLPSTHAYAKFSP